MTRQPQRPRTGALTAVGSVAARPTAGWMGKTLARKIFHPPRRGNHKQPKEFGLDVEKRRLPFNDAGEELDTWLIPGDDNRVVILGHGIGLSKSASLPHAAFLHEAGYTVLMFDHRNHGLSGSETASDNMAQRFTDDIATLITHLRGDTAYRHARIAVYGFSFSCFPATYVLRDHAVDAVVCDSGPVVDLSDVFGRFVDQAGLPLPAIYRHGPSRQPTIDSFSTNAIRALNAHWPPPATGHYLTTPILFMAGEDDSIVTVDAVKDFGSRFPEAEIHSLPDTAHLQGMKRHPDDYAAAVLDFLGRAWQTDDRSTPQ